MSAVTSGYRTTTQAPDPDVSGIVGVLGGMGPAATADFLAKLVRETPATSDQEHLRTLVWSDATVPDRTDAILSAGPSPLPRLLEGVHLLQSAGAAIIAMPCSTAHAFLPDLRRASAVPILSMIDASVRRLRAAAPSILRVGLLATTGTLVTGLYQDGLRERGSRRGRPPALLQERSVMRAVRLIKAGELEAAEQALAPAVRSVAGFGAGMIVAACTELPLVLGHQAENLPVFDPTTALAQDAVALARRLPRPDHTKERP
ncbi:aspartate racemase [Streptomyces sp. Termitarium-T10T-6]|nr:amino acid racemase [Streptomyces sp. Termitarium-T10T-6]SCE59110.1 aspartate racemase [Streptomyces sp. Termitarium-T10T-6]